MSEPREDSAAAPPPPPPPPPGPQPDTARPRRAVAIMLAVALLVLVLGATAIGFLYGRPRTPPDPRIDRLEAALQQRQQDEATSHTALQRVEQRLGAIETKGLENPGTAPAGAVAQLERRLAVLESRPSVSASDIAELRQQIAKLSANAIELAVRLDAVEKAVKREAGNSTDTAIVLVLLQIRDAVAVGRPFAAEYEALLAFADPEITAAAAPLAEPAKSGVAGRAALATRLRALREAIAAAEAAASPSPSASPAPGWTDQVLDRLRRLVQIRRIDDTGHMTPSGAAPAAVDVAARALAGGDLTAAVAALDKLTGASAAAAGPWLRMAKQRLAVEAALRRLEAVLTARRGSAGNAATMPGSAR